MQQKEYLERLLAQYNSYFDIHTPYELNGTPVSAYCYFKSRSESYALVKRAVIYAYEAFEHVLIVERDVLTAEEWEKLRKFAEEAEASLVKPHKEHMYSYITLCIVCGSIDGDVKKRIRRHRHTKNYRFSIQGWSTVRVAAVDLSAEDVVGNPKGKEVIKVMQRALLS